MPVHRLIAHLVAGALATQVASAQGTVSAGVAETARASSQFVQPAPNDANAPLLRTAVVLDVHDVPLREALNEIARQMGGRLLYDEAVASLDVRVTLEGRMAAGDALRQAITHTGVKIFVPEKGKLVVLKLVGDKPAADSVRVRGTVVDSATREPIASVRVSVDGSNRQATTDERGNFILARVSSGSHVLSAHRLGYSPLRRTIVLEAGRDTSIVIVLRSAPNRLKEIVTTGAGDREKLEIGNSVVKINVDSIMATTPVATMSSLLAFRVPGLMTQRGSGAVGSPTRLRLRGTNSIESDNAPIIILDGIRITNDVKTAESNTLYAGVVGGAGSNDLSQRLDDIDPNSVASIEVLKGPAASTLYGSDAAAGVIIIRTKRGQAGPPRWTAYADHRILSQTKDYEFPVKQLGGPVSGGGYWDTNCNLYAQSMGQCVPADVDPVGFNMLQDPRFTPQATGYTQSMGMNVTGGNEGLQYYLGGTYLRQLGTAKLPEVNQTWIEAGRGGKPLPEEIIRPNARRNASVNSRITGTFMGHSNFALGASFISQYQRVGNDGMSALLGSSAIRMPNDTSPVDGWASWYGQRTEHVKHVIGNATINLQPQWWGGDVVSGNVTYGWDYSMNDDRYEAPRNSCAPLCQGTNDQGYLGYINAGRRSNSSQSLNLGTTVNLPVTSWLSSHSRLGANYQKNKTYSLYGNNSNLGVGRGLYTARGTDFISELGDERATAGWYFEEQLNLRQDRLFVTGGLRQDAGSAFGDAIAQPVYSKWNVSWVASEEPFFRPLRQYVSLFRVRFATGSAGIMPASTARLRTYAMQGNFVLDNGSPTGDFAELASPGNPNLRAERSQEYEGGFDIDLFDQRVAFDATWFRKFTRDAIYRGPVAGSVGPSVTRAFRANVGDVYNKGFELGSTVRVLDNNAVSYVVRGSLSSSTNELTRLAPGIVSFISLSASGDLYTGNETRVVENYPLFGRWAYPITGWADENQNDIIDPWEVHVGDSLSYVGPNSPKYVASLNNHLGFLGNRLTVDANFAYSGGMTQFNSARRSIAQRLSVNQGLDNFEDQACIMATYSVGNRHATDWCFMETVKVLRFQDLSVGYMLPTSLVKSMHVRSASVHLTANNIAHWSNYHGIDPGINTTPVNGNAVVAGAAFPAPREYGIRVQVQF